MCVGGELRPSSGITTRISSLLNTTIISEGNERFLLPQIISFSLPSPHQFSVLFSLKLPQICEKVTSVDIILRQKQLFPRTLTSEGGIFNQL